MKILVIGAAFGALSLLAACVSPPGAVPVGGVTGGLASPATAATPSTCVAPSGTSISATAVRGVIAGCSAALAAKDNVLLTMAIDAIPYGTTVAAGIDGACLTAEGICKVALDPNTQAWLAKAHLLFASKGQVVLPDTPTAAR